MLKNFKDLVQNIKPKEYDIHIDLGDWVSTGVLAPLKVLPKDGIAVLICFFDGTIRKGALYWDIPSFEDIYEKFQYWDDPDNEGQEWDWGDIVGWQPLPKPYNVSK